MKKYIFLINLFLFFSFFHISNGHAIESEKNWISSEELLFDWEMLAGKKIEIRTNILGANISDKTLSFIDSKHRIVLKKIDRDQFLWVYKNCNINHICGARVKGTPEDVQREKNGMLFAQMMGIPLDGTGQFYNDFYATNIDFYIYLATGIGHDGSFYYSFIDTDEILESVYAKNLESGKNIECCKFFEYWVPLPNIINKDYSLNYSFHKSVNGDLQVFHHEGTISDIGADIVAQECELSLKKLPWFMKLDTQCYLNKNLNPFP